MMTTDGSYIQSFGRLNETAIVDLLNRQPIDGKVFAVSACVEER